jgi:hypothetical protein
MKPVSFNVIKIRKSIEKNPIPPDELELLFDMI